jgi:hypothetical protein
MSRFSHIKVLALNDRVASIESNVNDIIEANADREKIESRRGVVGFDDELVETCRQEEKEDESFRKRCHNGNWSAKPQSDCR